MAWAPRLGPARHGPPLALLPCLACTAASYNPPQVCRTEFFKKGPEGGGVGDADWMLLDGGPLPPPLFQMLTSRFTPGRSLGNSSLRKLASLGEEPCQFCQPGSMTESLAPRTDILRQSSPPTKTYQAHRAAIRFQ